MVKSSAAAALELSFERYFGGDAPPPTAIPRCSIPGVKRRKFALSFVDPSRRRGRGIGSLLLEPAANRRPRTHGFLSGRTHGGRYRAWKLYAARGYIGTEMVRYDVGERREASNSFRCAKNLT